MKDLISSSTRGQFRQLMTDISSYRRVANAFQDEGFAPNPDCTWDDSSVRRTTTQQYLESVDWTNPSHVGRACRAFERLLAEWAPDNAELQRFHNFLRRDGYTIDSATGQITPPTGTNPLRPITSLAALTDPSAIQEQLDHIQRAIIDDPALAIGSAKELVESTAKVVTTIATALGELRNCGLRHRPSKSSHRTPPPTRTPRRQRRGHLVANSYSTPSPPPTPIDTRPPDCLPVRPIQQVNG
ncbi:MULTISPECIES: hypothetical protein [Actinosynnema]|uniref:hypothetical protein n=1 Tax=Actinosynnema TaxID=40566 RepID=UPI0020A27E6E|nr:hypothetical protein [Actinosynnema pretiosum]MCP2098953.1 hypothetical protein [Actinosynnema pretiosum]